MREREAFLDKVGRERRVERRLRRVYSMQVKSMHVVDAINLRATLSCSGGVDRNEGGV